MNDSVRTGKRPTLLNAVAACCLFGVLLVCYYQGFNGPFLLDHVSSVLPAKIDGFSIGELSRVADVEKSGLFDRAIPVVSFALNNYLGDGSPFSFKVSNYLLHALTAIALYAVLIRIFIILNQHKKSFTEQEINKLALFCTAMWVLHPLQISTALYVVQRMATLSALFSILAVWLFLILRTSDHTRTNRSILIVLIGASILAACLSKAHGVLAFAHIGFVELVVLRFRMNNGQILIHYRRSFLIVTGIALLGVVYVMITQQALLLAGYSVRDYGVWERLMTEPGVLLMYLKLIVPPNIADMSLYHDAYPIVREPGLAVIVPTAIILLIIISSLVLSRRLPILLFGVGFFLISHSMESTFLPLELVIEHRNYLALIGVLAPIAWLTMLAAKALEIRLSLPLLGSAIIALLPFQTYSRSIEWSDKELFHRQALFEQYSVLLSESSQQQDALVVGARSKQTQASLMRSAANRFYNWLASRLTGFEILDLTSGFRAVRRKKFMEILYLLSNKFSCPTTSTMAFFRPGYFVIKSFYQYGDALVHHVIVDISHWHCFRAGFIISLQRYSR